MMEISYCHGQFCLLYLILILIVIMRKSLLINEQLTLLSQRSSARANSCRPSMLTSELPVIRTSVKPSKKVLQVLSDKASLLPEKNVGVFRWLLEKYSRFSVLNPEQPAVLAWNIVNLVVIGFYLFEIGMLIGWGDIYWQDELSYFYYGNIFFILFFLADIMISPLKAYYQNGILVQNRVSIFKRYYRLYIWFDLLAFLGVLIPYVALDVASNYFKVLFVFKLVTAYDLDKYLMLLVRNRFRNSHLYAMARIIFFMIFWSHWLGVGFFAIDYMVYASNYYGPNTPMYCWLYNSALGAGHNLTQEHWTIQYLYTLYFSVGNITTIAYGDITARNPVEAIYTIYSMTMAILLFTYFFKGMIEVIFLAQADDIENSNNISLIRRYLKNNKVSSRLEVKIRSYFETNWEEQRFRNRNIEIELISKLPVQLKEQLNISLFGQFIASLGLLSRPQDPQHSDNKTLFIYQLSNAIQFERITAGQVLYLEGQNFEEHQFVYFCDSSFSDLAVTLGQGTIAEEALKISNVDRLTEDKLNRIHMNGMKITNLCGMFGETSFFTRNHRDHWAISNKNIEILKLNRDRFDELIQASASPLEKEMFSLSAESISTRFCYLCRQQGHRFSRCHYATYVPDFNQMLKRLKETNERQNNQRIRKMREAEQIKTAKYNCWKTYSRQKKNFEIYNSNRDSWSNEESSGSDSFRDDFVDQLMMLRTIVREHLRQNGVKGEVERTNSSVDVDEGFLFKVYHCRENYNVWITKANQYMLRRKLQRQVPRN